MAKYAYDFESEQFAEILARLEYVKPVLVFGVGGRQFAEATKAVADQGAQLLLLPAQNMIRRESAEKWKDKHSEPGRC